MKAYLLGVVIAVFVALAVWVFALRAENAKLEGQLLKAKAEKEIMKRQLQIHTEVKNERENQKLVLGTDRWTADQFKRWIDSCARADTL